MELIDKLSELIRNKGVTAYQVSMESGVSQAALSQILNGSTKKLSNKTAKALSEYFGVSKEYLMQDQSNILASEDNSGTIVNNAGHDNFFAPNQQDGKDELIQQLRDEVEYLRSIVKTLTTK